jgi:hypothetical protein
MSMSVYTGLNALLTNTFCISAFGKSLFTYKRGMFKSIFTGLNPFSFIYILEPKRIATFWTHGSKYSRSSNIQKKDCGKTSTSIFKASRQKHSSWQLYSNEKNGLQQFQRESCHPIKILKDKKKRHCPWWPIFHTDMTRAYTKNGLKIT